MINKEGYLSLKSYTDEKGVKIAAVSKTHGIEKIQQLYDLGQRIFAENKAQEMVQKHSELPADIEWHFVGHLQRNKVKYIAPFVSFIHSVDSLKLLKEINKEAGKNNRTIDCLFQIDIAEDETKFGMDFPEAREILAGENLWQMENVNICGLMAIATLTDDRTQIEKEFESLSAFFEEIQKTYFSYSNHFKELSIGMTGDYDLAIKAGSTIIRVGSYLFGERHYG